MSPGPSLACPNQVQRRLEQHLILGQVALLPAGPRFLNTAPGLPITEMQAQALVPDLLSLELH